MTIAPVRFGEVYELRFQKKGSAQQEKHPPDNMNNQILLENSFGRQVDPDNNLTDYLDQNNLAGLVLYDPINGLEMKDLDQGLSMERMERKGRWVLLTDGPQDKSLSRYGAVQRSMEPSLQELKAGKKDIGAHNRELIKRFILENLFPAGLPQLVMQYATRPQTPEEMAADYGDDPCPPDAEPETVLKWTNRPAVLRQIQADRIDRHDPTPLDTEA